MPESGEPVDVVNNGNTTHTTSPTVENHGPDPKPSNKEILSNPTLFQSHLQELDQELIQSPTTRPCTCLGEAVSDGVLVRRT